MRNFHAFGGTKKVERLGNRYTLAILAMTLASCSGGNFGFQGGVIPENFKGVETIKAISPESLQLQWEGYPGATQYRVYTDQDNNPISQPQFTSIVIKPGSSAGSTRYSVTAIDPSNGTELGSRTAYMGPVALLPRFNFKASGHIVPVEPSGVDGHSLRVSWTGYADVTYRVYLGERSPDGSVNYNSFVSSSASTEGSSVTISDLLSGHEYCAVVVASYLDNTNDGPDGTPYTGETSSVLNGWAVGASGTFGDSKIASSQLCARTSSSLSVDNVKVYGQKAYLSNRPIFYVYSPNAADQSLSTATIETSIYQVSNTTGLASFVGKVKGQGQIISLTDLAPGRYKFYASIAGISGASAGAMAKKEISVVDNSFPDEAHRPWIYIRGTPDIEDTSNPQSMGYYPEKQQDGYGAQGMGSSVAMGDFDCDGKYDIAIGIPNATETSPRDDRSAQSGKVIVYYDIDDSVGPSASPGPRSQLITFDITPYDSAGRDLRLGTKLYVGNFNHDNQQTNQPPNASGEIHYQCQDLVIGSGYGPMFVLYGKRNVSGLDGGLSYSGSTGYSVNPSSSCDPSTNICSPALYTLESMGDTVGTAISSGDFNGDSYEDLVATTTLSTGNVSGTLVFRGSEYGLIPPAKWTGTGGGVDAGIVTGSDCDENFSPFPYPDGPKKGFPYIPANPACWTSSPTLENGWGKSGFGKSVGVFPNAYYDYDGTKGSNRIRDVLLIGNPSYSDGLSKYDNSTKVNGRVYVCLPQTNTAATLPTTLPGDFNFLTTVSTYDMNQYFMWKCGYSDAITYSSTNTTTLVLDSPLNGVDVKTAGSSPDTRGKSFGSAIQGLKNPLLYGVDKLSLDGNLNDNFDPDESNLTIYASDGTTLNHPENVGSPGAVAIGASGNSKIFVYYGVQFPEGSSADASDVSTTLAHRQTLGSARNLYLGSLLAGTRLTSSNYKTVSEHPCVVIDGSTPVSSYTSNTAYTEYCDVQVLSPPSGANWSNYGFGKTLFALMGSNDTLNGIRSPDARQSILAAPAPLRNISSSGSVTYTALGSVQLFYQNIVSASNGFPLMTKPSPSTSCAFCRYSDGFTNAGSSSVEYDGEKRDNLNFGSGGIAAGPVKADGGYYNANADLVVGVPGYVFMHGTTPVIDSGAAQLSFSHGGQFRSYQTDGTAGVNSPWHFINNSFGQEADIRYFQTISMGDIDQDGLDDVAVRIKLGSENKIRILKGKASSDGSISFKNTSLDWTDFSVMSDSSAGSRIIPVGRISTSQFPVYFITGDRASYLYFGGIGGLIPGQPSAFAAGGAPRKLSAPTNGYLDFSDQSIYHSADSIDTSDYGQAFAHGDFNGDGYEDLAIGFNSSLNSLHDETTDTDVAFDGMSKDNVGRVMVFYGGKDNGFQVQAQATGTNPGGFPYTTDYFAPYSSHSGVTTNTLSACDTSGTCNRIQVLYDGAISTPTTGDGNTANFGENIAAIPAGSCNGKSVSALLVQTKFFKGGSKILIYKPKCLSDITGQDKSGLVQDPNASGVNTVDTGATPDLYTYNVAIDPSSSNSFEVPCTTNCSSTFGTAMTTVKNITVKINGSVSSGDARSHLVLTDPDQKKVYVFPLVSNCTNFDSVTGGAISNDNESCQTNLTNDPAQGYQVIDYSSSNTFSQANVDFGASIADIGDANGDGYGDVAISVGKLTRPGTPATSSGQQGAILVLFGGASGSNPAGLQAFNGSTVIEPSRNSSCYRSYDGGTPTSICNPTLLFAPEPSSDRDGSGEYIYLTRDSHLNFGTQNENLGSFLFGVPLRDTQETNPSDRILRGGAFYVLP